MSTDFGALHCAPKLCWDFLYLVRGTQVRTSFVYLGVAPLIEAFPRNLEKE
jgi:hypothetical protein